MAQKKYNSKSYVEDITNEYLKATLKNKKGIVKNASCFVCNNKTYYVSDKNKVLIGFNEMEVAHWIAQYLHKNVELLPNIGEEDGISVGDYLINKKDIWELKTIRGNGKKTIDSAIKNKKNQAKTFIIDVTYSKITNRAAINQSIQTMNNRKWIKQIIVKKHDSVIAVLHKKRN